MFDQIARQLGAAFRFGTPHLDERATVAFEGSFPKLEGRGLDRLKSLGTVRHVASRQLVSELDDPVSRVTLLLDGVVTVERLHHEDIEVPAGIAWNELTWASRGRVMGGRLHAGAAGATLIEWSGRRLHTLAMEYPVIHAHLMDAVMRSAGLHHVLQLEKARVIPPPTLRHESSKTLSEIIATSHSRPVFVVDHDDELILIGHASDAGAARSKVEALHPGNDFTYHQDARGFYASPRAHVSPSRSAA